MPGSEFSSMDSSPVRITHWKIFGLSSMGMFLNGYDLSVITLAMVVIPHQLSLDRVQYILVNASSFIGMLVGAPLLGKLADRIGRRRIFGLDLLFFVVFAIAAALSINFYEIFAFRLLLGIGIGGDYPISSTMMSEFAPAAPRGKLLLGMVAMYWVGALFSSVMNVAFIWSPFFWRYTFFIGGIIAIPVIMARFTVPESPRWLLSRGRIREASESMRIISGSGFQGEVSEAAPGMKARVLFSRRFATSTFFVLSAWFLFDVAAYGMGFYIPQVISTIGFTGNLRLTAEAGIVVGTGGILGYMIGLPFADRFGRRFLTISGFAVMFAALLMGSVIRISGIFLVPFYFIFVLFEQWIGAVTLFYPTEIFPTGVRASAQGLATAVSRVGAIMGIVLFPLFPVFRSLYVFSAMAFIGLIIAIILAPETRMRTLESISLDLKNTD